MKKEITKSILLFILSAVLLVLGTIILPEVTNIGESILLIVLACLILFYVYGYLLFNVAKKSKGVLLVLTLFEMIILTFVAAVAIINTWIEFGGFSEGTVIIGICLWVRGVVESGRAYYYQKSEEKGYPIYKVMINVLLITFGTLLYVGELLYNYELLYLLCFSFICLSIASIILGVLKLKK